MRTGKIDKRFRAFRENYFGPLMKCDGYQQALDAQILSGPMSMGPIIANLSAVGAGVIPPIPGLVILSAAGVVTATLAKPIIGTDDGKVMVIITTTAQAHTITTPANGLNGNKSVATFTATIGNYMFLVAFNGSWFVLNVNTAAFAANVTLA